MPVVVQKFGGSSVGDAARIARVAERVRRTRRSGLDVVVVVSAMQGETDRLLKLATALGGTSASPREADQLLATGEQVSAALLAMALLARGVPARSFTGAQMRLQTDGTFAKARLRAMDDRALRHALAAGEVVVATGFQGVDGHGNATTLGRGGSDTSAVALAAVLRAQVCEIYTDVRGVFTADPRICPDARKLDAILADEMLEMASLGSKVLQIRSVELAMNHRVDLRVRSTFDDDEGTFVQTGEAPPIERVNVVGVSHSKDEAKITLRHLPSERGGAAAIFGALAAANVNVDVIVQGLPAKGFVDVSFTVARADHQRAYECLHGVQEALGAAHIEVADDVGKVSIVGVGMMSHPGVAAQMFAVMRAEKIEIELITTSEIKVTTVVPRAKTEQAVRALHAAFALHRAAPEQGGLAAPRDATA